MKDGTKMQLVKSVVLGVILTGLLILSCNGQKKTAMDSDSDETATDSQLTLLAEAGYAPTDSVETHVFTSSKSLSKFFSKINRTRKPGIPVPDVDFSKDMVIIYCAGIDGNGTKPTLLVAEETDTEMVLGMNNIENKEKPVSTVSPFSIYKMPNTTKNIRFKAME